MIRLECEWSAFLSASYPGYHVVSLVVCTFSWLRQHGPAAPVLPLLISCLFPHLAHCGAVLL